MPLGRVVHHQVVVGAHYEGTEALGIVHLGLEGIHRVDHGGDQVQQGQALGGELNGALDAVEEGNSKLAFQFSQVSGDSGLAEFQRPGGFGHAAKPGHVIETDELAQFHKACSPWAP